MANPRSRPSPRRQRTPEEIAASIAVAKTVMQNQKKRDGIDEVKRGRTYIFIVAGLMLLSGVGEYYFSNMIEVFYFYGPMMGIYIVLGIYYYRNPFIMSIIALSLYILLILLYMMIDPRSLVGGIIWKVLIISALVSAIRSAKKYKDEFVQKVKSRDDILDDELLGEI